MYVYIEFELYIELNRIKSLFEQKNILFLTNFQQFFDVILNTFIMIIFHKPKFLRLSHDARNFIADGV